MTIIRRGSLTGITMRGGLGSTGSLVRFAVDWHRVETVVTPGDIEEQTIDDAVFEISIPATVDYEAQAIIRPTHPDADVSQITWSTSDESIATIDASGKVTRVSDGYIRIIATDQHGATARSGLIHIYRQSGVESRTFVRWVEGSLAKAATDAIDDRIAGADPQTDMAIFTTQDHDNGIYVRNPDCWAADLDLTGVSPWNSRSGALRAGVAISPRDVLTSEHYPLQVGDTIRFVAADNTVVTRTIAAIKNVGPANSSDGYATDFQVCTLSEDLPAEIKHYSVLPAEWGNYIRNLNIGLPTLGLDQEEKALVQDLHSLGAFAVHRTPSDSQRLAFYESKITGDSGNPSLLILDDEPVLVTLWTFGGAGSGPNIARLHDLINAAMTANGSPYQLTVADLSAWHDYKWRNEILAKTVAYFTLDDLQDSAGTSHLSQGTATHTQTVEGVYGNAQRFDADRYLTNPSTVIATAPGDVSICAWVKRTGDTATWKVITEYSRSSPNWMGMWLTNTNLFHFRVGNRTINGTTVLAQNQWYHVCGTYDAANLTLRTYVNGELETSSVVSLPANYTGNAARRITIGRRGDLVGEEFVGDIDELAIFNAALTADDVARIYAGDHPLRGPITLSPSEEFIELMKSYNFNGYWPLNETSGTIAFDHSGNGLHGTILANVGVADIDSVFADGSKAMRFTHMQDNCHIVLPDVPEINSLTRLTVMALARANSFHNTNAIISNARDCCGEYNGWDLWLNRYAPTQPRPALTQWNAGTLNVNQPGVAYTLEANRWYHIAATYDGSITKVYIDGVLALTSPISANRIGAPATYPTKIGKMGQSSTSGLDGWASHVAIKGEALSDEDIATIAAAALANVNT